MGSFCSKRPSKSLPAAAQTPGCDVYATNCTGVSADAPTRSQPVTTQPVGGGVSSNACLSELLPFRLDETEVLLAHKISNRPFASVVVWLGHYRDQSVAVKRLIDGDKDDVRFVGCTWTSGKDISVVTEYMDGGDLHTLLANRKIDQSWRHEKIAMAIDVAQGLAYIHSLEPKTIHRSLESRNAKADIHTRDQSSLCEWRDAE